MALYTTLHLHNVPDAQGADYAAWFDGAHRVSLSRLRGFVAADRYEIADAQLGDAFEPHRYLSVYDFDYNSPEIDLPALGPLLAEARDAGSVARQADAQHRRQAGALQHGVQQWCRGKGRIGHRAR